MGKYRTHFPNSFCCYTSHLVHLKKKKKKCNSTNTAKFLYPFIEFEEGLGCSKQSSLHCYLLPNVALLPPPVITLQDLQQNWSPNKYSSFESEKERLRKMALTQLYGFTGMGEGHQELCDRTPGQKPWSSHLQLLSLTQAPTSSDLPSFPLNTTSYPLFSYPSDGQEAMRTLLRSQLCGCQLVCQDTHAEGPLLLYRVLLLFLQPLYYWKVNQDLCSSCRDFTKKNPVSFQFHL